MMRRPRSLQARLVLLVIGTSLLVWAVSMVLAWRDARHELEELLDSHLSQSAALLMVAADAGDDVDGVGAPILHRYAPKVAFQVFHEGRLTMRSANASSLPMVAAGTTAGDGFQTISVQGQSWRVFATGGRGDMQVFVGEQVRSRDEILWAVLQGVTWPVLVALPLLALAGWWAVRQGLRPLRAMGMALARRGPEDLQPLLLPDAPAEIQPVAAALDGLFVRIAGLIERERRFTGDAAHELRTPIAAIRAQAQVALAATEDAQRRHALQATLEGCDRAARLVAQLLTLSRVESATPAARTSVDLAAVVRQVIAELAPLALARHHDVRLHADTGCELPGDPTLLAILARNLVDNAIRYAPPGARIDASVRRRPNGTLLVIEDSGPGLAEEHRALLGQPFFRMPGNEAPGSGLGWSIAQRIARMHGGDLQGMRSASLGGLSACAFFPVGREDALA